jgi:propeller protein
MNDACDMEVIGLTEKGDAVVRSGITPELPTGTTWESLSTEKPLVIIKKSNFIVVINEY